MAGRKSIELVGLSCFSALRLGGGTLVGFGADGSHFKSVPTSEFQAGLQVGQDVLGNSLGCSSLGRTACQFPQSLALKLAILRIT